MIDFNLGVAQFYENQIRSHIKFDVAKEFIIYLEAHPDFIREIFDRLIIDYVNDGFLQKEQRDWLLSRMSHSRYLEEYFGENARYNNCCAVVKGRQCLRLRGFGSDFSYCKQHSTHFD